MTDAVSLSGGRLLRYIHFAGAAAVIVATVIGPRAWAPWLAAFWVLMLVSNALAGGCPLTMVEIYLTKENVTVIDPFLEASNIYLTRANRNFYTLLVGVTMLNLLVLRTKSLTKSLPQVVSLT